MKKSLFLLSSLAAAVLSAVPVSDVTCTAGADGSLRIGYTLDNLHEYVVTLSGEAYENGAWTRLPDQAFANADGAVWRVIDPEQDAAPVIVWDPGAAAGLSFNGDFRFRPIVTAWRKGDYPDYMVVDLAVRSAQRIRYYPSAAALPGGLLTNPEYRLTKLVLRKIPAKGVTWNMGSVSENGRNPDAAADIDPERQHQVSFDNNYYMGVFEVTQGQWHLVYVSLEYGALFQCPDKRLMRPMDNVSYCMIRDYADGETGSYDYPNPPNDDSFLGKLNARFSDPDDRQFDLPSEAEWEYACRAGTGEGEWNNGTAYSKTYSSNFPGRCKANQVNTSLSSIGSEDTAIGPESGTAVVGSYEPNAWGLYDMHGNLWEWCLDWYTPDITALGGLVNCESGVNHANGKMRVRRGCAWNLNAMQYFRSACRYFDPAKVRNCGEGFRVKFGAAKNDTRFE